MIYSYYKKKLFEFDKENLSLEDRVYVWHFSRFRLHQLIIDKYLSGYNRNQILKEFRISNSDFERILYQYGISLVINKTGSPIIRGSMVTVYVYYYLTKFPWITVDELAGILKISRNSVIYCISELAKSFPDLEYLPIRDKTQFRIHIEKFVLNTEFSKIGKFLYRIRINNLDVPVLTLARALMLLGMSFHSYVKYVKKKILPPPMLIINNTKYMTIYEFYAWLYGRLFLAPQTNKYKMVKIGKVAGNSLARFSNYLWNTYLYIKDCLKKGIEPKDIPYVIIFKNEEALKGIVSKVMLENNVVHPKMLDDIVKRIAIFQLSPD